MRQGPKERRIPSDHGEPKSESPGPGPTDSLFAPPQKVPQFSQSEPTLSALGLASSTFMVMVEA